MADLSKVYIDGDEYNLNDADAETKLANEITARQEADAEIKESISTAKTELQKNIDTEATNRSKADSTLQTNINNEETAREEADTELMNNLAQLQACGLSVVDGAICVTYTE